MSGMVSGTRVATAFGWQKVETLRADDDVLTFDNGLKTLRRITRRALWTGEGACPRTRMPLFVPEQAIGNREEMLVMPRQGIIVESDVAEEQLGDPFVMIRAELLDGACGVTRHLPDPPPSVFLLEFDEPEVIFASSGALCICPASGDLLEHALTGTRPDIDYAILDRETSEGLVDAVLWELEEKWIEIHGQGDGEVHRFTNG